VHSGVQRVKAMTAAKPEVVFAGGAELNADFALRVNSALLDKKKNIKLRTERRYSFWNLTDNGSHFSPLEILDYASGVFSIEMRYPFWDKRMIEFCLSLPPEQKLRKVDANDYAPGNGRNPSPEFSGDLGKTRTNVSLLQLRAVQIRT
jgi:hypothetical protein